MAKKTAKRKATRKATKQTGGKQKQKAKALVGLKDSKDHND